MLNFLLSLNASLKPRELEICIGLDLAARPNEDVDFGTPPSVPTFLGTTRVVDVYTFSFKFGKKRSLTIGERIPVLCNIRYTAPIRLLSDLCDRFFLEEATQWLAKETCDIDLGEEMNSRMQIMDIVADFPSVAFGTKTTFKHVVPVPDPYFYESRGFAKFRKEVTSNWIDWSNRRDTVYWRGQSTGIENLSGHNFKELPRLQLCEASLKVDGADCKMISIVQCSDQEARNELLSYFQENKLLGEWVPEITMIQYRYIVDIDGNANSWGFFSKLLMGSCILKVESSRGCSQWFYNDLQPWKHYVPVSNDLSDFSEIVEWCRDHQEECRKIGQEGRRAAMQMTFDTELRRSAQALLASKILSK